MAGELQLPACERDLDNDCIALTVSTMERYDHHESNADQHDGINNDHRGDSDAEALAMGWAPSSGASPV